MYVSIFDLLYMAMAIDSLQYGFNFFPRLIIAIMAYAFWNAKYLIMIYWEEDIMGLLGNICWSSCQESEKGSV